MQILSEYLNVGETCNMNSFHECLIDTGEYRQSNDKYFITGQCSKTYNCLPACTVSMDSQATCDVQMEKREFRYLQGKIKFNARELSE